MAKDKESQIIIYGLPNTSEAYELRDFLNRSVADFRWKEIEDFSAFAKANNIKQSKNDFSSYIELPNNENLTSPSVEDVAKVLGWLKKPKYKEYDVSIYGSGPAGLSAAVYAASEGLRTIVIEKSAVGGQAGTSSLIENYMGFPNGVSGAKLTENARRQAVDFGAEILLLQEGVKATFKDKKIYVDLADGSKMIAKSNICATGIEYRKLELENEEKFLFKGVYYGAGTSEAKICKGKDVFVVGGGNSSGQAAMHFSKYAASVTMVVRGESLSDSLSSYLIKKIGKNDNIEVLFNSEVKQLDGNDGLEEITIANSKEDSKETHKTNKLFICIGGIPNTEWSKDTDIMTKDNGYLITGSDLNKEDGFSKIWNEDREPFYLETSVPGSFAAGDVRFGSVKRVASAVGEGAMAVTFIHKYLNDNFLKR